MQSSTHAMARLHRASPPICLPQPPAWAAPGDFSEDPHPTPARTTSTCCSVQKHQLPARLSPGRAGLKLLGFPPGTGHQWKEVGMEEKELWRVLPTPSCNRTVSRTERGKTNLGNHTQASLGETWPLPLRTTSWEQRSTGDEA